MKVRIARIAKRMHNKFRGLYWRQMFVTVGMVLLTLFLLGVSFFSLSYNYARGQQNGELAAQAQVVGQLSASYLENGRYLDMEELQHEEDFQRLASFAATVSEVDFLICDVKGHVLLSTDASLSGLVVTMPEEMTAEVLEEGISSRRTDVDGLYSNKRFVVGVPAILGPHMQGQPAVHCQGPHKLLRQAGVIRAHPGLWHICLIDQERPSGEVQSREGQRFVHRYIGAPKPADPHLVSQRLPQGLSQYDTGVLHGMVAVHLQIALRRQSQPEACIESPGVQHVVKKTDPRVDLDRAAGQPQGRLNPGLLGFPGNIGNSLHAFPPIQTAHEWNWRGRSDAPPPPWPPPAPGSGPGYRGCTLRCSWS